MEAGQGQGQIIYKINGKSYRKEFIWILDPKTLVSVDKREELIPID